MSTIKLHIIGTIIIILIGMSSGIYISERNHKKPPILIEIPIQPNTKDIHYSQKDITCLKQNIYYEADGEPFIGKVAVGIVTLNRKNLSTKTICETVFEPMQFSWTINKKKLATTFSDDVNYAARLVLNKYNLIEELQDAVYFHETYSYPAWASGKRKITTIGNHIFYSEK